MKAKRTSLMSKVMVFILALAVVFTYSVVPMNQAYAASAKKPAQVKSLKATAVSSSSIKLTWKKAKNAKKYQIYAKKSTAKKYTKVATVKASKKTYTVKKIAKKALKANTKYSFKVRAINGKKKGKFSKVVKKTTKKKAAVVEKAATLGEVKSRTMTIDIDMSDETRYPAGNEIEVWVPVPCSEECEPYQTVTNFAVKADKAEVAEFTVEKNTVWHNEMAHIKWGKDTDPADRHATVSFDASRYAVSRPNAKEDTSAILSADAKNFLGKTGRIDPTKEIVKKYAKIAAGNATTNLGKAENIYNWIINNLERLDIGDDLGNGVTFTNDTGCGKGDPADLLENFEKYGRWGGHCTDLNSCFVGLCRAAGVPAREMFGIRMNDTSSDGQHCWAEFYIPGEGWTYADPGDVLKEARAQTSDRSKESIEAARKTDAVKAKKEALWLGVDNNRIVLSRGRDVVLEPAQKEGPRNTFGYPYAEMNGKQKDAKGEVIDCTKFKDFKYTITCTEIEESFYDMTADEWTDKGITVDQLDLNKDYFLNVRAASSYEDMHITGAVNVPVGREPAASGSDEAKSLDDAYKNADGKRIVIICNSGQGLAKSAMEYFRTSGKDMKNVTYLIGGATKYPEINPDNMTIGESHYITAEALIKDIESGSPQYSIIDVRLDKDNTGSLGTFDDSHLVTAVSAPVHDADNKALSSSEIVENLGKAGVSKDGTQKYAIICYYGGELAKRGFINAAVAMGVTADRLFIVDGGMWAMDPDWSFMSDNPYEVPEYFVSTGTSNGGVSYNGVKPDQLKTDINGSHKIYKVIDVRKAEDYEANHIPTAESAPVSTGDDAADVANIKAVFDKYGKGAVYCLICYSGNAYADKGQSVLLDLGVPEGNIVRLIGGDKAWAY